MAKAYQVNEMPTMNTRTPALNEYGQIPNLAYYPHYHVIAASATLTSSLSGSVVLVYGGTAAVVVTLPVIADGPFCFTIINGQDQDLTITAGTADTIITYNDLDIDSVAASTSSEKIGAAMEVHCDGTKLFVLPRAADGRYQTFTLAD